MYNLDDTMRKRCFFGYKYLFWSTSAEKVYLLFILLLLKVFLLCLVINVCVFFLVFSVSLISSFHLPLSSFCSLKTTIGHWSVRKTIHTRPCRKMSKSIQILIKEQQIGLYEIILERHIMCNIFQIKWNGWFFNGSILNDTWNLLYVFLWFGANTNCGANFVIK